MIKQLNKDGYIPILESAIIGCVAGLSAVLLSTGVSYLGALRIHLSHIIHPHLVLAGFGLIGGFIAGLLVEKVAPEASGSGIPQVKAALDRVMMPLNFRIAIVKMLAGIATLGSGLFLGREGPTVQLGASLAEPLSRILPTSAAYKRQLIAAGAGAGLAAAFNAPLAGVVFVLEELLKEIKASTIVIAAVACATSSLVVQLLYAPHLRAAVKPLMGSVSFVPSDLGFYLLLGILAGLCGALFNSSIVASLNFSQKILKIPLPLKVGLAGLISGLIISILPEYFHNYAGMRSLIIAGETNWTTVLLAFFDFFLLTLIAYGSGAPGGLFAPSLALGSALGYLVGFVNHTLTGNDASVAFALVGMGAFFSAIARIPLTAIVITFELTTNFTLLVPLMLTCIISSFVASLISKDGLYDRLMQWIGIHLRVPKAAVDNLKYLCARDVMHPQCDSFKSSMTIKDALPLLGTTAQRGFPVVKNNHLVGVVTQTDLSKLNQFDTLDGIKIADIMSSHPVAVSPYDSLEEILLLFSRHKFNWLPVVLHDKLQGIILQSDLLNALFRQGKSETTDNP